MMNVVHVTCYHCAKVGVNIRAKEYKGRMSCLPTKSVIGKILLKAVKEIEKLSI